MNIEKWLHYLKSITSLKVLINSLNLTPETEANFWKDLLATLRSEESPIVFDEETEDKDESLFGIITNNIDLEDMPDRDVLTSALYENLKALCTQEEDDSFWNESLQRLINFFIINIEASDKVLIDNGSQEKNITVTTLKEADAGNNFPEFRNDTEKWVIPWYNVDAKNYDEVRRRDEVIDILKNYNKLQYTRKPDNSDDEESDLTLDKWIRLLMPQYGRRVEVEDLDRNFWVIAQTIAAISAYLFDDDSPIPKVLEGMTREVSEIWENILYLWTGIAAISQNDTSGIQIISLPIQKRVDDHDRQYDFIDEFDWYDYTIDDKSISITRANTFDSEIIRHISYLTDQYYGKDLCVIPYIRINNYKHNWYCGEWYPGVYLYNATTKTWHCKSFKEKIGDKLKEIVISPQYEEVVNKKGRFSSNIYASKQLPNGKLLWSYPFSDLPSVEAKIRVLLYGCIRTVPAINCQKTENELEVKSITLSVYDAAAPMISEKTKIGSYSNNTLEDSNTITFTYNASTIPTRPSEHILNSKSIQIDKPGYYMGELASWKEKTASVIESENLFNSEAYVLKIGNYLPIDGGEFTMASVQASGQKFMYTSMRGNVTKTTVSSALSSANTKYYRFRWDTYNGHNDKSYDQQITSRTDNTICYSTAPEVMPCVYPTKEHMRYDGLVAAKNFLKVNNLYKDPCFIITSVGLTPWQGQGRTGHDIYWDSAFIPAIYFYIPHVDTITEGHSSKPGYDVAEYVEAYNNLSPISLHTDKAMDANNGKNTQSGVISIKQGNTTKEIGKIVLCGDIERFEGYFNNYNCIGGTTYLSDGSRWRQFFVISDKNEVNAKNTCHKKEINGGASMYPDGRTKYTATFEPVFEGVVRYIDVIRHQKSEGAIPLIDSQISKVSEASVKIDSSGYQVLKDKTVSPPIYIGKIVDTASSATPYDSKPNIAKNNSIAGFQQNLKDNGEIDTAGSAIYNKISQLGNGGKDATYFYGGTSLYWGQVCQFKKEG